MTATTTRKVFTVTALVEMSASVALLTDIGGGGGVSSGDKGGGGAS